MGIAFAATGLYFMLAAFDVLPAPGALQGPRAILFSGGLAFFFAGCAAAVRAMALASDAEWPADAPSRTDLFRRILVVASAGSIAAIGTWIAIDSGPRGFVVPGPVAEMRTAGEAIGRTLFGLGVVIVWICVIAITIKTVRKMFGRPRG